MPLYRFRCPTCNAQQDVFSKIAERDHPVPCIRCDADMFRVLAAPTVLGDLVGYSCPRTGKWIEGRVAHEENLRLHNCRVFEPGEKEAFDRRRKAEEADFDRRIDDTVESLIHEMPARKREDLYSDLQAGATAEIVRGDGLPNN